MLCKFHGLWREGKRADIEREICTAPKPKPCVPLANGKEMTGMDDNDDDDNVDNGGNTQVKWNVFLDMYAQASAIVLCEWVINFKFPLQPHQKYNITPHIKNLAFHGLLRWKMMILPVLTTSLMHYSLKNWENVLFELIVSFCYHNKLSLPSQRRRPTWNQNYDYP